MVDSVKKINYVKRMVIDDLKSTIAHEYIIICGRKNPRKKKRKINMTRAVCYGQQRIMFEKVIFIPCVDV